MSPVLPAAGAHRRGAAAGDATLLATLLSIAVGTALLVPSLALLFRLTLSGRLDQEFHPIGTDEEAER